VEVHPSLKDFFGWQLEKILNVFTLHKKGRNTFAILQLDLLGGDKTNNLPDDSETHSWILIQEVLSTNINELNTSLTTGKELIQVLSDFEYVEVSSMVNCSHINDLFLLVDLIKKIHTKDSIIKSGE
jgi:hypothetical protein